MAQSAVGKLHFSCVAGRTDLYDTSLSSLRSAYGISHLERSLSILLPVHNAQHSLADNVARLLDIAADLTELFELLIVDDGSTDHTVEIAHDLSVRYPQVDLLRHSARRGLAEVVRSGLVRTSGEIICVHEGSGAVDTGDLRELWRLRNEEDLVLARHGRQQSSGDEGWVERLLRRGGDATSGGAGFHMLRRQAIDHLDTGRTLSASRHEVRLCRADLVPSETTRPPRPNFLNQLRRLAWGE